MAKKTPEPKKIKLSTLVNNIGVLDMLYKTRLDGARAFRLRKIIKQMSEEYRTFSDARNAYITEHGEKDEKGRVKIEPTSPAFAEFYQFVQELGEAEIDAPEPFFTPSDLSTLNLSVEDIDRIAALGLLKEETDGNK